MTTPITLANGRDAYQTRNGREVKLFTVEARIDRRPVAGEIRDDDGWKWQMWTFDGSRYFDGSLSPRDLIPKPVRHKQTFWMNLPNHMNCVTGYPTKEEADKWAYPTRIACIKVELEFAEGDGIT